MTWHDFRVSRCETKTNPNAKAKCIADSEKVRDKNVTRCECRDEVQAEFKTETAECKKMSDKDKKKQCWADARKTRSDKHKKCNNPDPEPEPEPVDPLVRFNEIQLQAHNAYRT